MDVLRKHFLLEESLRWVLRSLVYDRVLARHCQMWKEESSELGVRKLALPILEDVLHLEEAGDFLRGELRPTRDVTVEEQVEGQVA